MTVCLGKYKRSPFKSKSRNVMYDFTVLTTEMLMEMGVSVYSAPVKRECEG